MGEQINLELWKSVLGCSIYTTEIVWIKIIGIYLI